MASVPSSAVNETKGQGKGTSRSEGPMPPKQGSNAEEAAKKKSENDDGWTKVQKKPSIGQWQLKQKDWSADIIAYDKVARP